MRFIPYLKRQEVESCLSAIQFTVLDRASQFFVINNSLVLRASSSVNSFISKVTS